MNVCIVIPTYNESENIIPLVEEVLKAVPAGARIFVVDDGSPDGTAALVRDYMTREPRVTLLERSGKLGMGSAYRAAFRKVLDEGGDDYIVTMDADFSHDPRYVPDLLRASAAGNDLVIGSRYVSGGKVERWELWRRLLSWGGNVYVRLVTGSPIRDNTAGFSCMQADFLRHVPFERIVPSGYAWWFTLRAMFWRRGAKIKEIPITFTERRVGESKINRSIIYEGLIEPWRIRFSKL